MKKKILRILTVGIIFVLLLLGGKLLFSEKTTKQHPKPQVSPAPSPVSPTKTELPKVIFSVDPPAKVVHEEESFRVDILFESKETISAVDLDITFNPQVLKLEKIEPGNFFSSPMEFSKSIDESEGKIFYALGSLSPTLRTGKIALAHLTFMGKINSERTQVTIGDKTLVSVKGGKKVSIILPK